jgi:AcrR family transcriptional regulator
MTEPDSEPTDIVAAVMGLAAERGWHRLRLSDIADALGVPEDAFRRRYPYKASVLMACAMQVEREATSEPPDFEPEDSVRDRLFELLMQRLDLLTPYKQGVEAILRDLPGEPAVVAMSGPDTMRLMAGILEQAGVSAAGPIGCLRCKGLAAIWLSTLREWSRDDSPDNARTMAALDAHLRRVEPLARMLSGGPAIGGRRAARAGG